MSIRRHITVPLVLGAVLVTGGCSGDEGTGIMLGRVGRADVVEVVEAPAVVTARASATLTAAADARVVELPVRDGQHVRAGQIIVRLDSPQARRTLAAAQRADAQAAASGEVQLAGISLENSAAVADARAERSFAAARAAATRIPVRRARQEALASIARARADYAAARAQAQQAVDNFNAGLGSLADAISALGQAQRVQTSAALAAARRTVAALTVRSPIDGIVTLGSAGSEGNPAALGSLPSSLQDAAQGVLGGPGLDAGESGSGSPAVGVLAPGAPVSTGQVLATVTDVSALSLTAQVDETDVLLVEPGTAASVELDALPAATYGARVRSIGVAPTTSLEGGVSYRVRMSLLAGRTASGEIAPAPRPGMSAYVSLRVRRANDAVAVPVAAVVRAGDRDSVWEVVGGTVRRRFVRLGAQGEERVQVITGLEVGDRIVVSGADRVHPGQRLEQ